ncbi:MAG TPA: hypothetical protein VL049_08570, partial [Candidatus Dormibacteraeota bacterium]|nr:hypothetical protein [Candidatus Dormibacteraeota bacterium]
MQYICGARFMDLPRSDSDSFPEKPAVILDRIEELAAGRRHGREPDRLQQAGSSARQLHGVVPRERRGSGTEPAGTADGMECSRAALRTGSDRSRSRLGAVGLGLLVCAVRCFGAEVFPERMCENLPEVNPEVKAWVAHVAPELAQVPVRELSEETALELFGRAAAAGWGGIDLFTDDVFRESCVFYLPSDALRAVDARFDFDLLTVIRGRDTAGRVFDIRGILAGLGKLLVFYDRDDIEYRNEREHRDFMLASRVEYDSPG